LRRGHAQQARGFLVEAPTGIEARLIHRLGDAVAGLQKAHQDFRESTLPTKLLRGFTGTEFVFYA
jgi:hypothetical protein